MKVNIIIFLLAIILNASANILIKVGMIKIGKIDNLLQTLKKAVVQPMILLGILSFGLALAAYSYVLMRFNLSIAYPIMVSMGLLIVILASYFILNETVSIVQIAGFILIIAGVWMVAK